MSRGNIHYWKCDRPAAFHGTQERGTVIDVDIEEQLRASLQDHFSTEAITLKSVNSQGNHLTWNAVIAGVAMFVRVENGPEQDGHLELESALIDQVRGTGVPTPKVYGYDVTRFRGPFAWQALENIAHPDLNQWYKQGTLSNSRIAFNIGSAIARWQGIQPEGYGPFDSEQWSENRQLAGYHTHYSNYFSLRLDHHLSFLMQHGFMSSQECATIITAIAKHHHLLKLDRGCFVHKDLALWNILGSESDIAAFIDFDDAISGDPMDDLSLLACFHDAAFLTRAFEGYQKIRPLPEEYRRRFWLHLLRNMLVKAVIRVGAGYFDRNDGFFLIGKGNSGAELRRTTQERIALALKGLHANADLNIL